MALALLGALIIGLSLGLLGSGGSILTIPILVFVLDRPEKLAIAEALAIVGSVSLLGCIPFAIRRDIDWKSVFLFGMPGMAGASAGAFAAFFVSGSVQLTLLALTMLAASGMLLFGPSSFETIVPAKSSNWTLLLKGFFIGCLTGLIGVGGGFLIVPSLVILCSLSMSTAVGTSLVIIAMNAWTGFFEHLVILHNLNLTISWQVIGMISSTAVLGCFAGSFFSRAIPQIRLRQLLGCCIFAMGLAILMIQL